MHCHVLGFLIVLSCGHGFATDVHLIDSKDKFYINGGQLASVKSHSQLISALLGAQPPSPISKEGSLQIASILKPSPLKKPVAHAAFSVSGLTAEELLALFPGRPSQLISVQVDADSQAADVLLDGLVSLSAANADVHLTTLGPADLTEKDEGLGQLDSPVLQSELAGLRAAVTQFVQRCTDEAHGKDVQVLEATLLGLQDVQGRYGAGSPELKASTSTLKQALQWAVEQLDAAVQGDITYQVAAINSLPGTGTDNLLGWKAQARARVLQKASTPWFMDDEAAQSRLFTAKAAGYGSFILLLYFLLGATLCLCNMRSRKDTLLEGNKKME